MSELIVNVAHGLGKGLIVNPIYYLSVALGALIIVRLVRSSVSLRLKWAGTILLSFLIFGFVFAASAPSPAFLDFTKAYWTAGRAVQLGWEGLRPHYEGAHGFVNLPIVAYVFLPLGLMDRMPAAIVFFAIGVTVTLYVWRRLAVAYEFTLLERMLSLFAIAAFGPLVYSLREGNTSHLLLLPLLLGVLDLRRGRDVRAGALFALAAIIKPPLLILGVLAFLRGRWAVVAGGAGVLACTALASFAVFGWDAHVLWYENIVRPFAAGSLPSFNAQSIASIASRLELGPSEYLTFEPVPLSSVSRVLVTAATMALLAVVLWAAAPWRRKRLSANALEGEVMLAIMLALLVGGLSWSHYFAWCLLPAAWVWAQARDQAGEAVRPLMLAGFVLGAPVVFESWRMVLGGYEPFSWALMSHLGVGALLLFAACVLIRRRIAFA